MDVSREMVRLPLAEFHRVLAPQGAVVFSTHHPARDWQLHSPDDYFVIKQVTDCLDPGRAAVRGHLLA